jgi:NAD-dependent SIR2 family protein deacetylase
MRFTATGPNIPNELIDAQKRGELLFFCGAGVSVPAGLPSFEKLTKNVAEKLYALDSDDNEISKLLFNKEFDRTFTALKRIYGDIISDSMNLLQNKSSDRHLIPSSICHL